MNQYEQLRLVFDTAGIGYQTNGLDSMVIPVESHKESSLENTIMVFWFDPQGNLTEAFNEVVPGNDLVLRALSNTTIKELNKQ